MSKLGKLNGCMLSCFCARSTRRLALVFELIGRGHPVAGMAASPKWGWAAWIQPGRAPSFRTRTKLKKKSKNRIKIKAPCEKNRIKKSSRFKNMIFTIPALNHCNWINCLQICQGAFIERIPTICMPSKTIWRQRCDFFTFHQQLINERTF